MEALCRGSQLISGPRHASFLHLKYKTMKRIMIRELPNYIGMEVCLKGWVQSYRVVSNNLAFLILRERSGETQVLLRKPEKINIESVLEIVGTVKEESKSRYNNIEVVANKINIISNGQSELPIPINKSSEISASNNIKYNPITLRIENRRKIFKVQSELIWAFREFMKFNEFTEIHSTKLVNEGLEGGGNMFEVNYFGNPIYLSQSPQFFKQMMVGVYERVFEVGKVYRAENSNSNRHLSEYVGLDFEMGFISSYEEIMKVEEEMLKYAFSHIEESCNIEVPKIESIPRITYSEAIEIIEGKKELGLTNEYEMKIHEYIKETYSSEFVFITEYPINKRPFYTMPSENEEFSKSFELLFRGMEITTGGQRIHNYEKLKESLKSNGLNYEKYEQYLMSFKYGMPPHGGCGIGTERIVKQLMNLNNVSEASLIPRTTSKF